MGALWPIAKHAVNRSARCDVNVTLGRLSGVLSPDTRRRGCTRLAQELRARSSSKRTSSGAPIGGMPLADLRITTDVISATLASSQERAGEFDL